MIIFVQVSTNAIGHAVRDSEIFIRRFKENNKLNKNKIKVFFYRATYVSNRAWLNLLKKEVNFVPRFIGVNAHRFLYKYFFKYRLVFLDFVKIEKIDLQKND